MTRAMDLIQAARRRGVDSSRTVLIARPATAAGGGAFTGFTLDELDEAAEAMAARLATAGAEPGRVYPVVVDPDENGVLTLLALWRLGAVPAPLNPRLTPNEREEARRALQAWHGEGAHVVLWTSGTSGRPRGVALSWAALSTHVDAVGRRLALDPGRDVWLASLSLAHVGGLMVVVRALLTGSRVVAPGPVGPEEVSALLVDDEHPLTHMSLVPTQLLRLLDASGDAPPPPPFRCLLLGGAHTPEGLLRRALSAGWPVSLTYGMTEMSSQVATATPELTRALPGTVGAALDVAEIRADPEGELLVRGPTMATAYTDGAPVAGADGWFRTGDLGRVDADGRVWITGRRGDRIITGGVNVDAIEVEETLRRHPAVADACVVGVADEIWGEVVAACVVPAAGSLDVSSLEAWIRERLAGAKRPRRWREVSALPVNANGKPDRNRVRELFASG